jgi:hypothetical protein
MASRRTGTWRERWAQKATQRRQAAYDAALSTWQSDDAELTKMISAARTYEGTTDVGASTTVLKRGERVFYSLPTASLVEVQRAPGQYAGGYSGFSFRLTRSVRYNVGGSRGTYLQGAEQLKVTDEGSATITSQRLVFSGSKNTREWAYSKLVSIEHDHERPITIVGVSNRQKVSGLIYPVDATAGARFGLSLALAHFREDRDGFVASLEAEQVAHRNSRPPEPAPALPEEAPASAAALLGVLKTIYTGKSTWKPGQRVLTGIAASVLTLAVIGGIGSVTGSSGSSQTPTTAVTLAQDPTPVATSSAAGAADAERARQHTQAQARVRRQAIARQRAEERRREIARQRAAERRRELAAKRARARAVASAAAAAAAARAAAQTATHACTTTSSGSCIQGGEFCPQASYGTYGWDGSGRRYLCTGDSVHPHWE